MSKMYNGSGCTSFIATLSAKPFVNFKDQKSAYKAPICFFFHELLLRSPAKLNSKWVSKMF